MEVLKIIYLFFSLTVADSKLIDDEEFDGGLSFVSDRNRLWRNGFIPYLFRDDRYSGRRYERNEKEIVRNVMARITNQLGPDCIKFLEVESCSGHENCLRFDKKTLDQCKASIGSNNDSYVTLESPHCFEDNGNVIIHEIGHVLGLVHEQNRPDRDKFVTIHDDFLEWRAKDQMKIRDGYGETHQSPYDYFSIMHYTSNMGCHSNKKCIELKQPYLDLFTSNGQNILESYPNELSSVDIYEISQAYNCSMNPQSVKKYAYYLKTILTAKSIVKARKIEELKLANHKKDVPSLNDKIKCPTFGLYPEGSSLEKIPNIRSWQECGRLCQEHKTCLCWDYTTEDSDLFEASFCFLKTECVLNRVGNFIISGMESCYTDPNDCNA